jgi:ubiquinone/menaquinone biosynthesis C-methylase UbiE
MSTRALDREQQNQLVRRRYDRLAPMYDALESVVEPRFRRWRREQWALVPGGDVLEVGVGTGKNVPFYPTGARVTALDVAPHMLARAERRARRLGVSASFELADAQALPHGDASFDAVVGTFVYCSVPDPVLGLREAQRVLRPGAKLILVEHVLSRRWFLRWLMRVMDPVTSRIWGAHMNRDTVENVRAAGFADVRATPLWLDLVQRIEAVKR